jgi:hypothetical protein
VALVIVASVVLKETCLVNAADGMVIPAGA